MHQPKIAQLGFQCLLDSGICFPVHAQKKTNSTKIKQQNKHPKNHNQQQKIQVKQNKNTRENS